MNPLQRLQDFGQSIWLDFIQRDLMTSGRLEKLIREDGLLGMTSNPKMFDDAISGTDHYSESIRSLAEENRSIEEIYEVLTVEDVRMAADLFRPVFDHSQKRDGFVSYEVSPHLARDERKTVEEARRLWKVIDRPNVFIKVPGTREGLAAIRRLISEGINVNVTLLFGIPRYREVAEAFINGLEDRRRSGNRVDDVASVASFFLSRIDVLVDSKLDEIARKADERAELADRVRGQTAIASAKVAYKNYREIFEGERFQRLFKEGARPQRLLWASTGTKNPKESDVKYIESLIGPNTVNTAPMDTLNAYRDHGNPRARLQNDLDRAERTLDFLDELRIDIDQVTQQLEDEGVRKFIEPFDHLMETLEKAVRAAEDGTQPVPTGSPG